MMITSVEEKGSIAQRGQKALFHGPEGKGVEAAGFGLSREGIARSSHHDATDDGRHSGRPGVLRPRVRIIRQVLLLPLPEGDLDFPVQASDLGIKRDLDVDAGKGVEVAWFAVESTQRASEPSSVGVVALLDGRSQGHLPKRGGHGIAHASYHLVLGRQHGRARTPKGPIPRSGNERPPVSVGAIVPIFHEPLPRHIPVDTGSVMVDNGMDPLPRDLGILENVGLRISRPRIGVEEIPHGHRRW